MLRYWTDAADDERLVVVNLGPDLATGSFAEPLVAPPAGYARWSLRLLEKHVALIEDLPNLDHSTIGRVLKERSFVLT